MRRVKPFGLPRAARVPLWKTKRFVISASLVAALVVAGFVYPNHGAALGATGRIPLAIVPALVLAALFALHERKHPRIFARYAVDENEHEHFSSSLSRAALWKGAACALVVAAAIVFAVWEGAADWIRSFLKSWKFTSTFMLASGVIGGLGALVYAYGAAAKSRVYPPYGKIYLLLHHFCFWFLVLFLLFSRMYGHCESILCDINAATALRTREEPATVERVDADRIVFSSPYWEPDYLLEVRDSGVIKQGVQSGDLAHLRVKRGVLFMDTVSEIRFEKLK